MCVCMYIFEKELLSCSFAHMHEGVSKGFYWLVLGRWSRDEDVFRGRILRKWREICCYGRLTSRMRTRCECG